MDIKSTPKNLGEFFFFPINELARLKLFSAKIKFQRLLLMKGGGNDEEKSRIA